MFYGSGAGKLPTASAVVGDIVEAAKNPQRSMMATWEDEKLALEEKAESKRCFFVRVKGSWEALKEQLQEAFEEMDAVTLEGEANEFGFVTAVMTEGEFEARAAKFPQICQMIRVEQTSEKDVMA